MRGDYIINSHKQTLSSFMRAESFGSVNDGNTNYTLTEGFLTFSAIEILATLKLIDMRQDHRVSLLLDLDSYYTELSKILGLPLNEVINSVRGGFEAFLEFDGE